MNIILAVKLESVKTISSYVDFIPFKQYLLFQQLRQNLKFEGKD